MLNLKYNSLNTLKYLNQCDIAYKYNLFSITELPEVEKVVFELPTNTLPFIENVEDDYQGRLLLKCYLAFYFINLRLPFINCNKFDKQLYTFLTNNNFQYSYKVTYNNFSEINKLLFIFLNDNNRINKHFKVLSHLNKKLKSKSQFNNLNVKLDISLAKINEYKDILNFIYTPAEVPFIKGKLNLIVKNVKGNFISINELRNYLFLWNW